MSKPYAAAATSEPRAPEITKVPSMAKSLKPIAVLTSNAVVVGSTANKIMNVSPDAPMMMAKILSRVDTTTDPVKFFVGSTRSLSCKSDSPWSALKKAAQRLRL